MSLPKKFKQSGDIEDFDVNFEKYLPDGDTIATVELELDIVGEMVITQVQIQTPIVKVWTSGGVNGATYKVTVRAATLGGRVKEKEFRVRIKDT